MAAPDDPYVTPPPKPEPVFNTFRRKPLRPFYSIHEFWLGMGILALLAGVLGWVLWRGSHPEAALFAAPELKQKKTIEIYEPPVERWVEPGSRAVGAGAQAGAAQTLAPFPDAVLSEGWKARRAPEMFDETNLYEKINGRETFYKSYGFRKLHFISLASTADGELTIDIELFDLGSVENALGALMAEASSPGNPPQIEGKTLGYSTRNGGFLAQGNFYARMIGSDDDESIRAKITQLRQALQQSLPSVDLPWAYALFTGNLKLPPAAARFEKENVFSFGFATNFYIAKVGSGETEIYVSRRDSAEQAATLAAQLTEGLSSFGQKLPPPEGAAPGTVLLRNEYINTVDAVASEGAYTYGVRLAPDATAAAEWLKRMRESLKGL